MNNIHLVELENNKPTTSSLKVAEFFKKDHSKILRDIKNILVFVPEATANFGLCDYIGENGQSYPMYKLNKTAFTLLAMGFTGAKATKFKLDYIKAFDEMETQLANLIVKQEPKQISRKELALMVIAQEEELERLETENNGLKTALIETETLVLDTRKELEHKQSVIVDLSAKVPDEEMRTTINRVVKNYAKTNNLVFPSVWSSLYTEFKYIYKLDLKTRAKHSGKSQLQEAEKAGKLEELYLLALKMYETEKVVATQATTEFEFIY
jgi:Rha family phage regulatory protein